MTRNVNSWEGRGKMSVLSRYRIRHEGKTKCFKARTFVCILRGFREWVGRYRLKKMKQLQSGRITKVVIAGVMTSRRRGCVNLACYSFNCLLRRIADGNTRHSTERLWQTIKKNKEFLLSMYRKCSSASVRRKRKKKTIKKMMNNVKCDSWLEKKSHKRKKKKKIKNRAGSYNGRIFYPGTEME